MDDQAQPQHRARYGVDRLPLRGKREGSSSFDRKIGNSEFDYNRVMQFRAILLALLFLFVQSPPLPAKDAKWFEVSSEHFLLFTDTNEAKGRRLLSDFENRLTAFSQAFGKVPARQFPIEIFLFNNEQDFIEALPHAQGEGEEQLKKAAYLLR